MSFTKRHARHSPRSGPIGLPAICRKWSRRCPLALPHAVLDSWPDTLSWPMASVGRTATNREGQRGVHRRIWRNSSNGYTFLRLTLDASCRFVIGADRWRTRPGTRRVVTAPRSTERASARRHAPIAGPVTQLAHRIPSGPAPDLGWPSRRGVEDRRRGGRSIGRLGFQSA